MSDQPKAIPFNADLIRAQLAATTRTRLAEERAKMGDYVYRYERVLDALHHADYPDEVCVAIAAALAAAWMRAHGD